MKKKFSLVALLAGLLLIFTVGGVSSHQVDAFSYSHLQKYGRAHKYTTPKKIRGVWVTKDKDSIYRKIIIRKHRMTFKPSAAKNYSGVKGKWTLYHQAKNWRKNKSENYLDFAQRYAGAAHWVRAKNYKSGTQLCFSWTYQFDNDASGNFYRQGKKLVFENIKGQKILFKRVK